MTRKTLVTGVAAAAVVGGLAAGVTSIAAPAAHAPAAPASVAVTPVVWGIPMPQAPAPQLEGPLLTTLNVLAGPGSFSPSGNKSAYIQGGTGRIEGITADRAYRNAAADGVFPLSFAVSNIDQVGTSATATVTATTALGTTRTETVQFFQAPNGNWQLGKASALSLLSSVG